MNAYIDANGNFYKLLELVMYCVIDVKYKKYKYMAMLVNNLLFKCQQEEKGKYKQL